MHYQPDELSVISLPTYNKPNPIKRHNPILVRKPIWRFRRKMTGRAARTRSEMIERTGNVCGQQPVHGSLLEGSKPTALRKDDEFDLMLRQTHSIDTHIPICSERSADAEEQEDAHGGEESDVCYESVHGSSHLPGVAYAEKKEADRDLHECEGDECLYPIGPADNLE